MGYLCLKLFAVLLFCSNITAYERLLTPCKQTDSVCLRTSCTELLNRTCKGVGEPYNIAPFDPLELPPMEFTGIGEPVTKINMRKIKVEGLKDMMLGELILDPVDKTIRFNATAVYLFSAGIKIDFVGKEKNYTGFAMTTLKTSVHVQYPFSLDRDENGGLHLVIHPETSTCEPMETPVFTYCPNLTEKLNNDLPQMALTTWPDKWGAPKAFTRYNV
ncbi:juvenile hormone-binding protein-like isoform X2 [Pectinophora gossypiella]|uniref:juvenile hormone-binding protein-like isoform X2 n=1 Tax=Pectinophora gossypiella TaxID=13191 RepID=UPI00214F1FA0|nr:juvenile hormone-binding protein-like isoform X2 [Pectinophora gossypiella]